MDGLPIPEQRYMKIQLFEDDECFSPEAVSSST